MFPTSASALVRRAGRFLFILAALPALHACKTLSYEEFQEKYPLRAKYAPRWETNEVDYEEAPLKDKIGRNFRDGLTGVVNNFVQAGFSGFTIAPTSGYIVQKGAVMVGDVIGLIDDNPVTEHVFLGIVSRQFLRFGSSGSDFLQTMGQIHDTTFEGERLTTLDYVGDKTFHTKAYGRPSAVATFGAAMVADLLVRPAGNFVLMFGGRKPAEAIDKAGLKVIQLGLDVPFL